MTNLNSVNKCLKKNCVNGTVINHNTIPNFNDGKAHNVKKIELG